MKAVGAIVSVVVFVVSVTGGIVWAVDRYTWDQVLAEYGNVSPVHYQRCRMWGLPYQDTIEAIHGLWVQSETRRLSQCYEDT